MGEGEESESEENEEEEEGEGVMRKTFLKFGWKEIRKTHAAGGAFSHPSVLVPEMYICAEYGINNCDI